MHQNRFRLGLFPRHLLLRERDRCREGKGGKGRERKRREGKWVEEIFLE